MALALTLLVGAGLAARSFQKLAAVDPGFDPGDVLTFGMELPDRAYATPDSRLAFHREIVARLQALPGGRAAAAATGVSLGGSGSSYTSNHRLENRPEVDGQPIIRWKRVSPGYFRTMGIAVVEGRDFSRGDADRQDPVAIVSRAVARAYWPGESAVGKGTRPGGLPEQEGRGWFRIVGVVDDVHELALHEEPPPMAYYPLVVANVGAGDVPSRMSYLVRAPNAASLVGGVRDIVHEIDPTLPIAEIATLEALVERA